MKSEKKITVSSRYKILDTYEGEILDTNITNKNGLDITRDVMEYGKFNLIDTPVGQIVKKFQDAGVIFGISIRGSKKGDANSAVLNLKELLLLAKKLGLHKYGMDKNKYFGDGKLKAVNYLLGQWGYAQNGIAGDNFSKRLHTEIEKKM